MKHKSTPTHPRKGKTRQFPREQNPKGHADVQTVTKETVPASPRHFWFHEKNLLLSLLFVLGVLLHFVGLTHPATVVFDEVHFGKYVSAYCCTGEYFFDIHPPHAKLIIAGVAKTLGFKGKETFEHIGGPYEPGSAFAIRFGPALVGVLIPILVFVLLLQFGASLGTAFLGGLFFVFDNALLVQTRVLALDGFLIFFTLASLSVFLFAMGRPDARERLGCFAVSGALASLAASTKLTGLVAPGLLSLMAIVDLARSFSWTRLKEWTIAGIAFLSAGLIMYFGGWYVHFALLPLPGPGDIWGHPSGHFWTDFVQLQTTMFQANAGLGATHHDASPGWSWPLMLTPLFYWSQGQDALYFLGNPVVWWGMSLLFLVAVVVGLLSRVSDLPFISFRGAHPRLYWIPLVGYAAAFLPLAVAVSRVLFLYHYLTPLIFSALFVFLWLNGIGFIRDGGIRQQRLSYFLVIVALLIGFLVISPVTFGIFGDSSIKAAMFDLLPGWR